MKRASLLLKPEQDQEVREAYQKLRTNLLFGEADKKAIAVTSCRAGEGKSMVCLRLGQSMAKAGKKVVILDADLRHSLLSERIRPEDGVTAGLEQFLAGDAMVEDVVCATNIQGLYLLPAGKSTEDPAELLEDSRFRELMAILRKVFDLILVDTPALEPTADAVICAERCDGVLLVMAAGENRARDAEERIRELTRCHCPVIGIVMTKT